MCKRCRHPSSRVHDILTLKMLFIFRSDFPFLCLLSEHTVCPSPRESTQFHLINMVVSFKHSATWSSKFPHLAASLLSECLSADWRLSYEYNVGLSCQPSCATRLAFFSVSGSLWVGSFEILTPRRVPNKKSAFNSS